MNQEYIYMFLYQTNKKGDRSSAIKLNIMSMFADCLDLARGQIKPYTILEEIKTNLETQDVKILYTHPSMLKENVL